jgi:hypothetical protein
MKRFAVAVALWTVLGLLFALQLRLDAACSGRQLSGSQRDRP